MDQNTAYYVDWLAERYHFDTTARHQPIEQQFLQCLPDKAPLCLVDVGAGTGANCRYLMEKISVSQEWLLIEQNPAFSQESLRHLEHHGQQQGYTTERSDNTLTLTTPTKTVQIKALQGSLLDLHQLADLSATDVVVANAVFDLFTADQFEAFVSAIAQERLLFFATLNYENMHFLPAHPLDEKIICLYHDHMQRVQSSGTAMGPGCVEQMVETLQQYGYAVKSGNSLWHLHSQHKKMMQYLLNFMVSSIAELSPSAEDAQLLHQWKNQKETATALHLIIEHQDILGYF